MTHYVYRLYDVTGDLLYVGVSKDPTRRFRGHKRNASWSHYVKRGKITVFPTIDAALAAEQVAIRDERPRFNVVHNRDRRVPMPGVMVDARCWFVVRVYDEAGRLLKVGHTRSLETWMRNQRSYSRLNADWFPRAARVRMAGPYTKPVLREVLRAARTEVAA